MIEVDRHLTTVERMASPDPLRSLGVRVGPHGGELRVFSANATAMELCLFDAKDPNWLVKTVRMSKDPNGVWVGRSRSLTTGSRYAIRVSGPAAPAERMKDMAWSTLQSVATRRSMGTISR